MGARAATEVVALHHTREALALAGADNVHNVARREHVDVDAVTNLVAVGGVNAHFAQMPHEGELLLAEVSALGLGQLLLFDFLEAQLDGIVTIPVEGPHLGYDTRPGFDHGDAGRDASRFEHLGHAQFPANNALNHFGTCS
jgi:hypothetical protein